MGRATSVGALSVPSAWAGAAPSASPAGAAMQFGGTGAIPAAQASAHSAMPPMMPVANMAGREGSAAPTRFELRSTVIRLCRQKGSPWWSAPPGQRSAGWLKT
ncbi:MAG: hypothetical protein WBZ15_23130 [Mycobacterium sp.]|uniref:PPE family protein, SVP subgroup n=1 Tax=Mycobacterium sp. TaxID=1785 RepID=UPI003C5946D2